MAYVRKTEDEYHLLVDYGYGDGWEHEVTESSRRAILDQVKTYRENSPGYAVKWEKKRVPVENNA